MPGKRKPESNQPVGERLQKVLAAAGLGSRRECESLIVEGRVEIDRQVVSELGSRVDTDTQEVRVDGDVLKLQRRVYYALNKPPGILSTSRDPEGRPRVIDLLPSNERLFTVGRLDKASEGLILLTNDGEWANRLTHPRYGVHKTYLVRVAGLPTQEELRSLQRGVHLAEARVRVENVKVKKRHRQSTDLEIVLKEGRNREIRRILAFVGHKVLQLTRVAVGNFKLGELPTGAYRPLNAREAKSLLEQTNESTPKPKKRINRRKSSTTSTVAPKRKPKKKSAKPKIGTVISGFDETPTEKPKRKTSGKRTTKKTNHKRKRSR